MSDNELLEKVIRTTEVGAGGGGLLSAEQSNRFIDYMWDSTVLGSQVRTIRMRANEVEIDKVAVGERLVRLATEAVDDGVNAGATFSKISLTTKKLRLDWELSTESLEDNIEGAALEDHIARLMATQAGKDLEDVAINGDVTLTGDPLLKAFDGWAKIARTLGHVVDAAGDPLERGLLDKVLRAMPRNYMQRRGELKFYTGSSAVQDYLFSFQNVSSTYVTPEALAAAGINRSTVPTGPAGFITAESTLGVPIQEVPLFLDNRSYDDDEGGAGTATLDHTELWLTFPQNMLWGVKREIKVYREFKNKKDTIEYTMFTRVGTQVENPDAFVVARNIKVRT